MKGSEWSEGKVEVLSSSLANHRRGIFCDIMPSGGWNGITWFWCYWYKDEYVDGFCVGMWYICSFWRSVAEFFCFLIFEC